MRRLPVTAKRIEQPDVTVDSRSRVRPRFASVVVSVIAHASAIVWIAGRIASTPSPSAVAATSEPAVAPTAVASPEAPPLTIELVELDAAPRIPEPSHPAASAVASVPAARAIARARPRADHAGAASSALAPIASAASPDVAMTVEHPPGGETGTSSTAAPGTHAISTMRSPNIDQGLSDGFVDNFLGRTRPLAPEPPALNTAAHANDDKLGELELGLANPRYREIATSEEIENAKLERESLRRERDNLTMVPSGGGRYRNREESFTIDIAPDGTVAIKDKPAFALDGLGVRFDVADMIMRARGEDPYARAKLHFLDKTRDERAGIGRANRTAQLGRSAQLMRANIDRLWAMTRDPRARRDGLFELWDDCAETGDAELRAGAAAARLMVIGEIRARLRGADAYTEDELGRLNARRTSIAPFAPYSELAMRAPVDDPD